MILVALWFILLKFFSMEIDTAETVPAAGPPLYAVLGHPVAHSLSPQMQMAAFTACQIPARYLRIDVPPETLPATVQKLKSFAAPGWNCTLPLKNEMLTLVDEVDPSAQRLGVVNTVLNDAGRLIGFNTDGEGWMRAIREEFRMDVHDLRIMILGAGGAGRAVAVQAALERCERLVIVNRTFEKSQALVRELEPLMRTDKLMGSCARLAAIPWNDDAIAAEISNIDLLVNATSVGVISHDPLILPVRLLQPHLMVYDLIYRPAKTKLMEAAQEVGARGANGLGMLLHQGAAAFTIWTGISAPLDAMRTALLQACQSTR